MSESKKTISYIQFLLHHVFIYEDLKFGAYSFSLEEQDNWKESFWIALNTHENFVIIQRLLAKSLIVLSFRRAGEILSVGISIEAQDFSLRSE